MMKRIFAIAAIFACTAVAWVILGTTVFARTDSAASSLFGRVASTWGAPQEQGPVEVQYEVRQVRPVTREEDGKQVTRQEEVDVPVAVAVDSSNIHGKFHVDYRQKGLLWFSTYTVDFDAEHTFRNPTGEERNFVFRLPLPAKEAITTAC
jgi:hypothetical protein